MFDVFCSIQDVETGENFNITVFTDNLDRCFTYWYNCVKAMDSHLRLLSFHALVRIPSDEDF